MRSTKCADGGGAMLRADAFETAHHLLQRDTPFDFMPFSVALDHRSGQALLGVDGLVGESVLVGQPALVDFLVLERKDTDYRVLLDLHHQIGAQPAMRADRLAAGQLPSARRKSKRFGGKGSD